MATLSEDVREELVRLYAGGNSAQRIATHFGVSLDSVYYALRRFEVQRRNRTEANAAAFALKPLSFRLKPNLSKKEEVLKAYGIALYWGEGYKAEAGKIVDFANSDEQMVRVFLSFLRRVCRVDERKFRVLLYCHDKAAIPAHIRFWSKATDIPAKNFTKPYVAKRASIKGKGMPHGLIHVRYGDKKLLDLIRSWIREYADQC